MIAHRLDRYFTALLLAALMFFPAAGAFASSPAGYSEYYVPGDEDIMGQIFADIGAAGGVSATAARHTIISVIAWSGNTKVYYDHWEDGYNFDPNDPSTADETITLTNKGDGYAFESASIPLPRTGAGTCKPAGTCRYDGRDHIYVAGGAVTVTRMSWIDSVGTVFQIAWDVYPVKPQMTTYILPFGDDLFGGPRNYYDFSRVFALVQATKNSTVVTFDVNQDGVYGDTICTSHTNPCTATAAQVTLNAGQTFLVDRFTALPATGVESLRTGTGIQGSDTLQVNYVVGDQTATYEARGFSAFPRGFWDTKYYAPVPSDNGSNYPTQLYVYNPNSTALTIEYQTTTGSGTYSVPAGQTRSFSESTGSYAPEGSGVFLKGDQVFWGVSTIDSGISGTTGQTHEWGYPLVPVFLLGNDQFVGWAPGAYPTPPPAGNRDDSGLFITPAQDNTWVYVDTNHDGTPDQTYKLNRLQTQYVYDAVDGDMSNTDIWSTGPLAMAFGQNPDTSPTGAPAIDLGYVVVPSGEYMDKALTMKKTANPVIVGTSAGSTSTYTLVVDSYYYAVNSISVKDTLPAGWQFVNNSATITRADKTTISGVPANPTITGGGLILTWPTALVGSLAPNQKITVTFTAQTTAAFGLGAVTRNIAEVTGTRTVGGLIQTFVASDFVFNSYGNVTVSKTSSATNPVYPGDQFTYTMTVTNPSAAAMTGVAIYDPLPPGVSYVSGSSLLNGSAGVYFRESFNSSTYTSNADNVPAGLTWLTNWREDQEGGDGTDPTAGRITIVTDTIASAPVALRFNNSNRAIARMANLSAYSSAMLSFDARRQGLDNSGDWVEVQVCQNAGNVTPITCPAGWVTVVRIDGATVNTDAGYLSYSYDLGSILPTPFSSTFALRFSTIGSGSGNGDYVYFDNVQIKAGPPLLPPNFLRVADNYTLAAGATLTLTFNVRVDNPLAAGISQITNTAYVNSNEIPLPKSASVTNTVVVPGSQSAEVSGYIWLDSNGNGTKDVGEPGLANVEVTIKDKFGSPLAVMTTDSTGHYDFPGLVPDSGYYVQVTASTLPAGLQQSAPAGRSDNRSNTFTLTAGQVLTNINVGYKTAAGTAAFGDLVWSDANANALVDPGEPGLGGIAVQLWLDVNKNGIIDAGDTLTGTTTTTAGGSYLFTGVAASGTQNYIVYIDPAQAALAGFSQTTPHRIAQNVTAGSVFTNFDFGFQNPTGTFSIKDRIWNDVNRDKKDDGEAGISSVTVDLLDASRNVIATTSTDANGYFTFSGVIGGGADYTIRVTDTAGILNNYFGVTPEAIAGEAAIDNLSANLDFTVNPIEPHFGFGLNRTVSGTVFNDLNGNGTLDAGETGMGGVTVRLYGDTNGNGLLDGGEPLLSTLVTGSSGVYVFSGLANGNYIVSIPATPAGYTYTTESPDNDPAAGEQQAAAIAGGGTAVRNFGYRATVPRTISGTVWEDANSDGVIDATERRLSGVTLDVLLGGVVVATVSTDAGGNYAFANLTTNTYVVRVTDTLGVLAGYREVFENDGSLDNQQTLNLAGASASNIRFGYRPPGVTFVALSGFRAFSEGGRVRVEWTTSAQIGTAGFYLLRRDEATGDYVQVNPDLLPALLSVPQGATYRMTDNGAVAGRSITYILVEVEARGKRNSYGPFTVAAGPSSVWKVAKVPGGAAETARVVRVADEASGYSAAPLQLSAARLARLQAAKASADEARYQRKLRKGTMAKIPVTQDGLQFVGADEIASLLGKTEAEVRLLIDGGQVAIRNQGKKVAYLRAAGNAGIFFYGQRIDNNYTDRNIYWLYKGKGWLMQASEGAGPAPVGYAAFTENVHAEQETMFLNTDVSDPDSDYWFWSYLFVAPGYTDLAHDSFTVRTDSVADLSADATLTVNLKGFTDTAADPDHHARVRLNGTVIGEGRFDGTDAAQVTMSFDQRLLYSGDNTVTVEAELDPGVPYSAFYVDSFDVTYQRLYMAAGNSLTFSAGAPEPLTVYGFTSPEIFVLDVTDPLRPLLDEAVTVQDEGGSYSASFVPVSTGARYQVLTPDAAIGGAEAWTDAPSRLRSKGNAADYLIIAPAQLQDAVQSLAEYRQAQGYRTMVVDVEDIMDEFNHGNSDPRAIREFLSYAHRKWERAPRYVVLAGEGTYDYKDHMGYGDNLVPTMIVSTPSGLFPSDTYFGDFDGDRASDIAIGRLPVLSVAEVRDLVAKISAFENTRGTQVMMLADNPDFDGNYPADSDDLALLVPAGFNVEKLYLPYLTAAYIRDTLLHGLPSGIRLVTYMGHGNPYTLADEGILTVPDVALMTNSGRAFVLLAMTCAVGDFGFPGYDALGEALVMKQDGGAAAVISPSGLALNDLSRVLGEAFVAALGDTRNRVVLGDVLLQAFRQYRETNGADFTLEIYNLLGDPAMKVRLR